ncbi:hypothetical protein BDV32DRAFT_132214 [Aspergillus pseudonomiae]|nr:hypothetical protein BDV32DRAFT_132214 [Aspergillus pseudonomiae]
MQRLSTCPEGIVNLMRAQVRLSVCAHPLNIMLTAPRPLLCGLTFQQLCVCCVSFLTPCFSPCNQTRPTGFPLGFWQGFPGVGLSFAGRSDCFTHHNNSTTF